MKTLKKILLIPLFAIVCMFVRIDSAAAIDYPFSVTTSSIAVDGTFQFKLSAQGTFYVDCGTGGTLSSDDSTANGMISGGTINKTDTNIYTFKCTYSSAGTKTIRFGGTATQYNTGLINPTIGFNTTAANAALITSISGNLAAVFPYISASSGYWPRFYRTFRECNNLTSLPETLFSFSGDNVLGQDYMFWQTFQGCTGLTSIPGNLFSHITGIASGSSYVFHSTFKNCTGLTSIPANLFSFGGNNVEGQTGLFQETFSYCSGLTSIPGNLFSHITGVASGATSLFGNTFQNCSGLTSIPENLFSFGGNNVVGQGTMFGSTFGFCSGLTSIPANLFSHVTSVASGASGLFPSTFYGCSGLTSIPENLFSFGGNNVEGLKQMFYQTFKECTGLTSLPANLFSHITSAADTTFKWTFLGCTGLTGYIPASTFAGLIANGSPYSGSGTSGMMYQTFNNTGSLRTSCPSGTTQYTTGYEDYWDSHVACTAPITCSSGYYLPAGSEVCTTCPSNKTCPGGTFTFNPTKDQGFPIALTWYDGNSTISGPSSCLIGGTFLPPTPPARTGYVFNGWKIKPRTCGIPSLDTSIDGTATGYSKLNGDAGSRESNYGLTVGSGQWAVEFSYGTVWGMANCNDTKGQTNTVGTPTLASSGTYCWCQATGFTASGNDYTSGPQCTTSASSSWVYCNVTGTADGCARFCANSCAYRIQSPADFRTAVFGAAGQ